MSALKKKGKPYSGFLYVGLMIKDGDPYLIEYNVRMGDPECQTILPMLQSDLSEIFFACCNNNLKNTNIIWTNKKSLCVVMCSKGYPDEFKKNIEIPDLNKVKQSTDQFIFHAGTNLINNKVYAIGGRVLNFVYLSNDFSKAKKEIHNSIDQLNWAGGFYRKDIGHKVIS